MPDVTDVGVTAAPDDGERVEIVCGPDFERVPPRVLRVLADHDCGVRDVSRQGDRDHFFIVAV